MIEIGHELGSLAILDPKRIRANLDAIRYHIKSSYFITIAEGSWGSFLHLMHPELQETPRESIPPRLVNFTGEFSPFRGAIKDLLKTEIADAEHSYPQSSFSELNQQFLSSLEIIEHKFPSIWPVFIDLIAFVILAKKQGYDGGTVSSRIGLIWIAPKEHWNAEDWAELLVHEFIHNVLFVEDMVRCLFVVGTDRLSQDDVASRSAIRREIRGYDKSYHSAFVAYGLIRFHLMLGNVDKARKFLSPLIVCVEDLVAKALLVSDNGLFHLRGLAVEVLTIQKELA